MNSYQTSTPASFRITPQLIIGLLIVFVGIIFTLDELGVSPALSYLRYWPMAIIAIGIVKMLQAKEGGCAFAGLIITLVGVWLQGEELGLLRISLRDVWPVGLVLFGGYLVWQGLNKQRNQPESPSLPSPDAGPFDPSTFSGPGWTGSPASQAPAPEPVPISSSAQKDPNATMSVMAIMGGVTRNNNSKRFRAADLLAIMGGLEIDLRKAEIHGDAVIDVFALWGGIDIRVPPDWTVVSHVVPLMAGVEDSTRVPDAPTAHRLTLRGFVMMAGVDIKN